MCSASVEKTTVLPNQRHELVLESVEIIGHGLNVSDKHQMSFRRSPVIKNVPSKDHTVQVPFLINLGTGVTSLEDTRPPHLRNKFQLMKDRALKARIPRMPGVFEEEPIASGTYGFIFRSVENPRRVYKASANHRLGTECPASFRYEHDVSNFITKLISSKKGDLQHFTARIPATLLPLTRSASLTWTTSPH